MNENQIKVIMPGGEEVTYESFPATAGMKPDEVQAQIDASIVDKANLVDGTVPADELPSYVDDIATYPTIGDFPVTGEDGKIYVAKDTNLSYRWDGSGYIQINAQDNVLYYSSASAFPQTGASNTLYVALDTNKVYDWQNGSYHEVSMEDHFEMVTWQTADPLADAQVRKALEGKLVVYHQTEACYCWPERTYGTTIFFLGHSQKAVNGTNVPKDANFRTVEVNLDTSTKLFSSVIGGSSIDAIRDIADNVMSETETPSGNKIVRALNLKRTQDMIAADYDTTQTYSIGDVVIYQNQLYRCLTAIDVAEAWNANHWQQVSLTDDNAITLSDASGTLSDADFAKACTNDCVLIYSNAIYHKHVDNGTFIQYVNAFDVGTYAGSASDIIIYKASKTYSVSTNGRTINRVFANESLSNNEQELVELTVGTTKYKLTQDAALSNQEIADAIDMADIDPILANNSWAKIRKVCEAGLAGDYWSLGDTKTDLGTDGVTRTFRICDMQGLYGKHVVFEQVELEATSAVWNRQFNVDDNNCYNDYNISNMRTTVLPALLLKYSTELSGQITNTTYKVAKNGNSTTILDLTDKLFLPAEKEIFGSATYSRSEEASALTWYALYQANNTNAFRIKNQNGSATSWWERSPYSGIAGSACNVFSGGGAVGSVAYNSRGVAPCFSF